MKVKSVEIESSNCGHYEATIEFVTDRESEVRRILENKDKEFAAVAKKRADGLSAMCYAIDDIHLTKAARARIIKDEVIFSPPATILIKGGKKYVSKAHNEEYDEEKGLLMCLAKANGISHLELKRMIKNAKRPERKAKK